MELPDKLKEELSSLDSETLKAQATMLQEVNPALNLSKAAILRKVGKHDEANEHILMAINDLHNALLCLPKVQF